MSDAGTVVERYDAVLVDLDGVVYRGNDAVAGATDALARVRALGIPILYLTNNSARTPDEVVDKLAGVGVEASPRDVLTSGLAAAAMLRRGGCEGSTAFVIGERGVREALEGAGIRLVDGEPDRTDLVVIGWDRGVDYPKLRTAALLVQRGARLIATNEDASYPAQDGLWPGAGALLAAVTATTGARPEVAGKPRRPLYQEAAELTGAKRPLAIGDRLDTDVTGAAGMGWDAMWVTTGAQGLGELATAPAMPTYVARELSALFTDAPPARFRTAVADDAAAVRALLQAAELSPDGVEERLEETLVSEDGRGLVATACLQDAGGDGLLRGVAVREDRRGLGLGVLAIGAALQLARSRDHSRVGLFTETATSLFETVGFRKVEREELPDGIRRSEQALGECGPHALAMMVDLR